jgi:predicted nucleotidyltransferase
MEPQAFTEEEIASFRAMGRTFAARARREAKARAQTVRRRLSVARRQLDEIVARSREVDPEVRVVLFGSMARGTPKNPSVAVDLAVDSDRYWELLGVALDREIPVVLIDLRHTANHIRSSIDAEAATIRYVGAAGRRRRSGTSEQPVGGDDQVRRSSR